jgi:putative ABC transport system substrate-binding protein
MAAKLQIFDQPVVFCMVLNPEAHGLPAFNMTGVAVRIPAETQLSRLRSVMPGRTRIGVLYDEDQSGSFVREALHAAKRQGLDLVAVALHKQEEIPVALRSLLPKIDVLWLIQDQLVVSEPTIPFFVESTLGAKIPLFTFSSTLVQQGAVGALVVDPWTVGQQTARITLSRLKEPGILRGHMDPPDHPQLALNLNSAEYLGLTVNAELIRLAGHVFSGHGAVARQSAPSDQIP